MIEAICSCGERYEVKDDLAGKRVRCLACSGEIGVPDLVRVASVPRRARKVRERRRLSVLPTVATAPTPASANPATLGRKSPRAPLPAVPVTPAAAPARSQAPAEYIAPTAHAEARREISLVLGALAGYAAIALLWLLL